MILEGELSRLESVVAEPRAGLFGPGSRFWEINRHSIVFLGAGRAALLQLAHPWVAQAIHDHSRALVDPVGRFNRTFLRVFAMVYGDLDRALHAARRVHHVHETVYGTLSERAGAFALGSPYRARDIDALLWVHATLWDTAVAMYESVLGPLDEAVLDAYYDESRRFAALFGIPDAALPACWTDFQAYNRDMWQSDRLVVTETAAGVARALFRPLHPTLGPVFRWYRVLTASFLPDRIRAGFGLEYGPAQERLARASLEWIRRSHRFWPRRLRYLPAYIEAERRASGTTTRDPIGEWINRALVAAVGGPPGRKIRSGR